MNGDDRLARSPRGQRPILRDPRRFLVLPMPRPMMGSIRVDGHRLRVRACPACGCNTTIQLCPLCGGDTESSRPPEDEASRHRAPVPIEHEDKIGSGRPLNVIDTHVVEHEPPAGDGEDDDD